MKSVIKKHPLPWYVFADKLRPNFSDAMIVEVCDANAQPVLPWGGFDAMGVTHKEQKAIAKFIVDAVNNWHP